jgi:hypothetical protein
MIVSENIRKCVVFIGYQLASGEMRLAGSGFYFGSSGEGGRAKDVFLVTARHVVDGIRKLGLRDIYIRVNNTSEESSWAKCSSDNWLFHPTDPSVDVALFRTGVPDGWDHLVLPIEMSATPDQVRANEVSLGDEVFIVGLFRHHQGTRKNIPIVRVGNLAALTEEKVATKLGLLDAYLIEARSIGGLSGSPVFLNLGVVRYLDKAVKHSTSGPISLLLGLNTAITIFPLQK